VEKIGLQQGDRDTCEKEWNKNKSLRAPQPSHSAPASPAVTVTCGAIGGKTISFSSASSSRACSPPTVGPVPVPPRFSCPEIPTLPLRSAAVQYVLSLMLKRASFSVRGLKREVKRHYIASTNLLFASTGTMPLAKPHGLHIKEMWDAKLMQPGKQPLDPLSHHLNPTGMDELHKGACSVCINGGADCYWDEMRQCVTHGWNPPLCGVIPPSKREPRNNAKSTVFHETFQKEARKLVEGHGGFKPVVRQAERGKEGEGVMNPMGIVLKSSEVNRAGLLTGVRIEDQESLSRANALLEEQGQLGIKARLTVNASAPGVNAALYKPGFSYPSVEDAVSLLYKGAWMGKGDVSRYYLMFPLAKEAWPMCKVGVLGLVWNFITVFFGLASAAYYASVWSAEVRTWALSKNIRCTHMMDDWLVVGGSKQEAMDQMGILATMLVQAGFAMAEEKFDYGQRIVFLGLLIDTIEMTMSFDPIQCSYMLKVLTKVKQGWKQGAHPSYTEARHIAGKLNWFAEVVQSGRMRNSRWWSYLKEPRKFWADETNQRELKEDIEWWEEQLKAWATGRVATEYPIMSLDAMLEDNSLIQVCCSDASMPDGHGYLYGSLDEDNPAFLSATWQQERKPVSSMGAELMSLEHYMDHNAGKETLIIWNTDALSAAYAVNSGRCGAETEGWPVLKRILARADQLKAQVVAVWAPRDLNKLADFLSHLSHQSDRESVEGRVRDLRRVYKESADDHDGCEEAGQEEKSHFSRL
jgi:hypothetical protein